MLISTILKHSYLYAYSSWFVITLTKGFVATPCSIGLTISLMRSIKCEAFVTFKPKNIRICRLVAKDATILGNKQRSTIDCYRNKIRSKAEKKFVFDEISTKFEDYIKHKKISVGIQNAYIALLTVRLSLNEAEFRTVEVALPETAYF